MRWYKLESVRVRKLCIFLHLFILHIYYPMRKVYKQRYGSICEAELVKHGRSTTTDGRASRGVGKVVIIESNGSQWKSDHVDAPSTTRWIWRGFPLMWPGFYWYRLLNSIWMVFIVIKYSYPLALTWPIEFLFSPERPAECYLLGRFMYHDEVSRVMAISLALYHLGWRYVQIYDNCPLMISAVYFLIMDERDISNYYLLLARQTSSALADEHHGTIARGPRQSNNKATMSSDIANQTEKFMHDVMSCRIVHKTGTIYKLRPNRTVEAGKRLRRYLSKMTLFSLVVCIPFCIGITIVLITIVWNDKRYLKDYIDCDLELNSLNDTGQLSNWSFHNTGHQMLATPVDFWENYLLWSESGMACVFTITLALLLDEDLHIYWRYIDEKVSRTLEYAIHSRQRAFIRDYVYNPSLITDSMAVVELLKDYDALLDDLIYELQMEIEDLIRQIEQTDYIISDLSSMFLTVWFSLYGFYTYSWRTRHENLPTELHLALAFVVTIVIVMSNALLSLQRKCLKTYPNICSLMAWDNSRHKYNFIEILDSYNRKRMCYTIYRHHPVTTTFFLTVVAYSFSVFFILGSVVRH